jgi:hypothetical protein
MGPRLYSSRPIEALSICRVSSQSVWIDDGESHLYRFTICQDRQPIRQAQEARGIFGQLQVLLTAAGLLTQVHFVFSLIIASCRQTPIFEHGLEEFDDSREVVQSLIDEYRACERPDYIEYGIRQATAAASR